MCAVAGESPLPAPEQKVQQNEYSRAIVNQRLRLLDIITFDVNTLSRYLGLI